MLQVALLVSVMKRIRVFKERKSFEKKNLSWKSGMCFDSDEFIYWYIKMFVLYTIPKQKVLPRDQ